MSKIRSKNTKIEKLVFRELRKRKIYFQRHYKKIAGSPDIVWPKKKKAIFIDGDFWHGYNFEKIKSRLPKKYWLEKIANNIKRDKITRRNLRKEGWSILRIWEHELSANFEKAISRVVNFLEE